MKIDVKGLALGIGLPWALYMLLLGWLDGLFGWGSGFVSVMASGYIGFAPTFLGGIIGAVWGFVDGAICGALIALVYNWVTRVK